MNVHSCETREELVMNFAFAFRRPAGFIEIGFRMCPSFKPDAYMVHVR